MFFIRNLWFPVDFPLSQSIDDFSCGEGMIMQVSSDICQLFGLQEAIERADYGFGHPLSLSLLRGAGWGHLQVWLVDQDKIWKCWMVFLEFCEEACLKVQCVWIAALIETIVVCVDTSSWKHLRIWEIAHARHDFQALFMSLIQKARVTLVPWDCEKTTYKQSLRGSQINNFIKFQKWDQQLLWTSFWSSSKSKLRIVSIESDRIGSQLAEDAQVISTPRAPHRLRSLGHPIVLCQQARAGARLFQGHGAIADRLHGRWLGSHWKT